MRKRVAEVINNSTDRDTLRYFLYSAHDVQVANVLSWLQPEDFKFVDVPYVSNFHFELLYNQTCLTSATSSTDKLKCFSVQTLYNGQPLKFGTCLDSNSQAGRRSERCTYQDFVKHIDKLSFKGDLMDECSRPWDSEPPISPMRIQERLRK